MFKNLLILPIILAASLASAQKKKLDLFTVKTMTTTPEEVTTTETVFESNGQKYRKIEFQGEIFFVRLLEEDPLALQAVCDKKMKVQLDPPAKIYLSKKLTKRTSVFIQTLKTSCTTEKNAKQAQIVQDWNPEIGVGIDSKKRKHKVFVDPSKQGLGYKSDF
jgi:hypothetical protein